VKCVRCIKGEAGIVARAPDGSGAWEIYRCTRCNYCWRSTEPNTITDPALRDPFFQFDETEPGDLPSPLPLA
jgi:hypothetical protein